MVHMFAIRRLPITLLEIIIVMAILSLASGIVAISVHKVFVDQRFRTEVSLVVDQLRLAQNLMLILGTDVHLTFEVDKSGTGINYRLELETELPKHLQYEITRKKTPLKTIRGVFLDDELVAEIVEKRIDVKFLSNGAVMSKGILRLATSDDEKVPKGTLESFICLAGYPRPIVSSDTKEDAEKICVEFDKEFEGSLTRDTLSRLPEKLKQPDSEKKNEGGKEDEKDSDTKDKNTNQKDNAVKDKKTAEKSAESHK